MMADNDNTTSTPSPTPPVLATAYSALRSLGTVIGAIGTIWAFIPTDNLSGLYTWAHSSDAAAAGSALLVVVSFGWGLYRKWKDRITVTAASNVGMTPEIAKAVAAIPAEQVPNVVTPSIVPGATP